MIWVCVCYLQQDHQLQVLLANELPYTLLLGWDAPAFTTLVQHTNQEQTPATATEWSQDPEFRQAQEQDPFLDTLR